MEGEEMGYYSDVWVKIENGTKVDPQCVRNLEKDLDNFLTPQKLF